MGEYSDGNPEDTTTTAATATTDSPVSTEDTVQQPGPSVENEAHSRQQSCDIMASDTVTMTAPDTVTMTTAVTMSPVLSWSMTTSDTATPSSVQAVEDGSRQDTGAGGSETSSEYGDALEDLAIEEVEPLVGDVLGDALEDVAIVGGEWREEGQDENADNEEEDEEREDLYRVVRETSARLGLPQVEREQELERVEYDIAIPPQHSYLDTTMQRVEGYNYWLEGQHVNLILIPLDVIVIPGQTIPLRIHDTSLQFAMVRNVLDRNHNTFGAVHMLAEREQMLMRRSWSKCGVTVQILEVSEETQNQIVLKCKGRQRFKTVSTSQRGSALNLHAKVEILCDHVPARIKDPAGALRDVVRYSAQPAWLYRIHDVYTIMEKIKKEISDASPHVKLEVAPPDPVMFSYWLISAMPFKFNQRVEMLREDNLAVRLTSQLSLLRDLRKVNYCCGMCGIALIRATHLVSMSADGPFYVNPMGNVFETVTAYSIINAMSRGVPTEKDSWFPGYAWNFISCRGCINFLGWKFSATATDAQPRVFYGVQRSAVQVLTAEEQRHTFAMRMDFEADFR